MQRVLIGLVLMVGLIPTGAEAKPAFLNHALKDIRVVRVDKGVAYLQSADGTEAEVTVGDGVGREGGEVVEIGEAWVTVQRGSTRTRMPVVHGFEMPKRPSR